jgi:hypothetical protein
MLDTGSTSSTKSQVAPPQGVKPSKQAPTPSATPEADVPANSTADKDATTGTKPRKSSINLGDVPLKIPPTREQEDGAETRVANPEPRHQAHEESTCQTSQGQPNVSSKTYRLKVQPQPVVGSSGDEGLAAYEKLREFDHAPNPLKQAETKRLAELATKYQESRQSERHAVSVDGGSRTLSVSVSPGIDVQEAIKVVQNMYAASDPAHRQALKEVNFYAGSNPMDEYFEQRTGFRRDFVSEMTGGNGVINFYNVGHPDHPQCQDLFDHELAHIFMQESPESSKELMVPDGWAAAISADRADGKHEFVSSYARTNRAEDFAETYRKYVEAQRGCDLPAFRKTYPARAAILDRLFGKTPDEPAGT